MKHKHYVALGLSCLIFLPPIILLYFPDVAGQKIENVTPLDLMTLFYTIAFVWVTSTAFILTDLTQSKRSLRDDRKNHIRDIYKMFRIISQVSIKQENKQFILSFRKKYINYKTMSDDELLTRVDDNYEDDIGIPINYIDNYEEFEYFDMAIKHLKHKKYKDIYQHWENTKKLLEELNEKKLSEDVINEKIKSQMKEFFPDFNKYSYEYDNTYDPVVIMDMILALWRKQSENLSMLVIKKHGEKYCIITKHGTRSQMIATNETKLDVEKYKEFLKSIIIDESLKETHQEEITIYNKIISELSNFSSKLESLIKKLKTTNNLKGKCDSCP